MKKTLIPITIIAFTCVYVNALCENIAVLQWRTALKYDTIILRGGTDEKPY